MIKSFWNRHRIISWLIIVVLIFLLSAICLFVYARGRARASLPMLDGKLSCLNLDRAVRIERDSAGVPTVTASSLKDAVFAQGFLHAQDRFFQMDLSRRAAAGEIASLVGSDALLYDRTQRALGYRGLAARLADGLSPEMRTLLESYVSGVNKGLAELGDKPPEYLLLRTEPKAWSVEDTVLVGCTFFDALSYNETYEINVGTMAGLLPRALVDFLTPETTEFDAPMIEGAAPVALPVPGPEVFTLRDGKDRSRPRRNCVQTFDRIAVGSNNWAVAASRSSSGRAVLANDPHLRAGIPGTWYRMKLDWGEGAATGVTVAGAPGIIIGENGRVAWGFTNNMADHEDLVVIEVDPENPDLYRTADGPVAFEKSTEKIEVLRGESVTLDVRRTIWGPVVGEDWQKRPLALKSVIHTPGAFNLDLIGLMQAQTLEELLDAASQWYGPSQNVVAVDDRRIGWTPSGHLVARDGFDGKVPRSWADGTVGWNGQIERPRIVDPEEGILFTANARPVPFPESRRLSCAWVPAWRAARIRELLIAEKKHSMQDLVGIQLDTRNRQYDFMRELVLREVNRKANRDVERAVQLVNDWDGHAKTTSKGLHILKLLTQSLRDAVFAPLVAPCAEADETFLYNWPLMDEPLRRLLTEKPMHLLHPDWNSWKEMVQDVFEGVVNAIVEADGMALDANWAATRRVRYWHPLGRQAGLDTLLNMPFIPLPGDANTLRVQTAGFGASMRLVVSPGEADKALFQMPGGQSGHFMSPHYFDHHKDWANGKSRALAPGLPESVLELVPGS